MPIYEYRCRHCGNAFEELVFGSKQPLCPACEGADVERLLSVTAPGRVRGDAPAPAAGPCAGCPSVRGDGGCGLS